MNDHQVQWTAPTPLWAGLAESADDTARRAFAQPAILRFAADSFMEDFMQVLAQDPAQLGGLLARWEDWRGPQRAAAAEALLEPAERTSALARKLNRWRLATKPPATLTAVHNVTLANNAPRPLKLYQPAHQRYYLVTACLVCGLTGLPDRTLNTQERAFFVLRRLLPPNHSPTANLGMPPINWEDNWDEYAFVVTPRGSGWQKISGAKATLLPGEEQLPLFGMNYQEDDGRRRRLFAGVVPVGKREALLGASEFGVSTGSTVPGTVPNATDPRQAQKADLRMGQFYKQVVEPWKRLIEIAARARTALGTTLDNPANSNEVAARDAVLKSTREQIQTISWFVLADFARWLDEHLPGLSSGTLVTKLMNAISTRGGHSLWTALSLIRGVTNLDAITRAYDESAPGAWPGWQFAFADVQAGTVLSSGGSAIFGTSAAFNAALEEVERIADDVWALLSPQSPVAPPPLVAQRPLDARDGWFVLRCVFDRPDCGPLAPPIVSAPTASFQLASFFDPDAPARPIRIALPIDTTPAGLRKFDKNTAFMISDVLCGQIKRVQGMTFGDLVLSVLPWPFHKPLSVPESGPCTESGGLNVGMMCSLSIPIITICALLLLMIIVNLLDIIFRWVPYFILCFPLPGFKAKQS